MRRWGTIFLIPALVIMMVDQFIPIISNVLLSLFRWDGFRQLSWAGGENYVEFFKDSIAIKSMVHSTMLGVGSTVIAVIIGLALALLIFKMGRTEGAICRLIFFMPIILPISIVGLLFTFVFNNDMGVLNSFIRLLGFENFSMAWLENKSTAMLCIMAVNVWKLFGVTMMLSFTALQGITDSLLEASRLDGANYWDQIRLVILPLIKPSIQLSAIFTLTTAFRTYDLVWAMTRGGPGSLTTTVPIEMIRRSFTYNEFGYAAAMGCVLTLVVLLLIFVTNKLLGGETYEY